jgi:hypothetical protein
MSRSPWATSEFLLVRHVPGTVFLIDQTTKSGIRSVGSSQLSI